MENQPPPRTATASKMKAYLVKRVSKTFALNDEKNKIQVNVRWQFYWLARIVCVVLHIVCGIFCALTAYVYTHLANTLLNLTLSVQGIGMKQSYNKLFVFVFAALAAAHTFLLLLPLVARIRLPAAATSRTKSGGHVEATATGSFAKGVNRFAGHVDLVFGDRGLLGVKGKHFEMIFAIRKLIGVVSQANQCYHVAAFVSRPVLVRSYVALLVVNCWATPLTQWLVRNRSIGGQRLCLLLVDLFFDTAWAVGVHTQIALGLRSSYDFTTSNLTRAVSNSPKLATVVENELRLVLIGSFLDLASRLVLHVGVMTSSTNVMALLHAKPREKPKAPQVLNASVAVSAQEDEKPTVAPTLPTPVITPRASRTAPPPLPMGVVQRRFYRMMRILTPCVGIAAVALHIAAEVHSSHISDSCVLPLQVWFKERPACAMIMLNCTATATTGTHAELTTSLTAVDPKQVQVLVVLGCVALHIPSSLQEFDKLTAIYIVQSGIVNWNSSAALTAATHPHLISFTSAGVQFPSGEIPDGLLNDNFPPLLKAISFFGSNLHTLPDTLDTIWPSDLYLFVEFSKLTVVPDVVARMKILFLSLSGNQITTIPIDVMYMPRLAYAFFRYNPITSLPDVPADVMASRGKPWPQGRVLDVSRSGLSSLPNWVTTVRFLLRLTKTPLCTRLQNASAGVLTATEAAVKPLVDCVSEPPPFFAMA